jgi:hypothetical protein
VRPKIVFIAHPIGGDVEGNKAKVYAILKEVHSASVFPIAPYLQCLEYLDDAVPEDRALGTALNHLFLSWDRVDELWLYGDRISSGMEGEITVAMRYGIRIVAMTAGTERDLLALLQRKDS